MDDKQNQNPNGQQRRPGVSGGFIFSIILVVGAIILMVWLFAGKLSKPKEITVSEFVKLLNENKVTEIVETPADTVVNISGYYKDNPSKPKSVKGFTFDINADAYNSEVKYYYTTDAGTAADVDLILHNFIQEKYQESLTDDDTSNDIKYSLVDPYKSTWLETWGPTLLFSAIGIVFVIFMFSRLSRTVSDSNTKAIDFNRSRARRVNKCNTKFSDVAGADEEKEEMKEIVSYLKDPKKFTKFGAKLPKGILLVGAPGCGKTLLAKAVAGEAGVPFFTISGSDFVEMFVGVGAGRVRDMFKTAKENAPCLVFIDEIDAVGRQRGAGLGGGNDEREQTLNQLLVEMDGFNDNSGIIVMAATNRDDVLDPALLRAGRFDRKITVNYPDRKGREEIFLVHARNKKVAPEVDFGQLAKRTVGFSGADIENIMNEAAILAVRRNKENIGIDEIDEAIDRRIAGPAKASRSLTPHEKEVIAYHESGHAIIGLRHPNSDKVQKITIVPRGNTGGHVQMGPEEDRFLSTKNELIARITGYLGGRASEEIFFEDVSSGAHSDIEQATRIARLMVCELGMSSLGPIQYERDTGSVFLGRDYTSSQKNFSSETALKIDTEIREIIETAYAEAKKIINDNKEDVILLAQTLIAHEQITAEEIDYLLEHRHLKRDEVPEAAPEEEKPVEENQNPAPEEVKPEENK
ncbi:MAG: ATP-dependent zinc metalloprotease FtsH [Bacilli bacterium]|nr:ATP-dependent zinc metalloprotease FtsH [Bacilli bacterium]